MATTISDRWNWVANRFTGLPVYVRRVHRILGVLWLLTFALSIAVPATTELPGPSIPGLAFVALILSGLYLLLRPWIRGQRSLSDLERLTQWSRTPSVVIRRTHRLAATLFLLSLVLGLALQAGAGIESPFVFVPVVVVLLYLALSGLYMFVRPWVNRIRTNRSTAGSPTD